MVKIGAVIFEYGFFYLYEESVNEIGWNIWAKMAVGGNWGVVLAHDFLYNNKAWLKYRKIYLYVSVIPNEMRDLEFSFEIDFLRKMYWSIDYSLIW